MWGKLARAGLIRDFKSNNQDLLAARHEEASYRREMILNGTSSDNYLVGMTVFYSFPTPVTKGFRFSDVIGVERLFAPILDQIIQWEIERIRSYLFSKDALLVFVQKSSWLNYSHSGRTESIFWPLRGKGASGADLANLLK